MIAESRLLVVPAETLMFVRPPPAAPTEAVMVEPASPKVTPFKLEKTTEPRLLLVVPAEKLTEAAEATAPITVMD